MRQLVAALGRRLLRAARADGDRAVPIARTPIPSAWCRWRRRSPSCPSASSTRREADAVAHGRRVAGWIDGPTRLTARGELIAIGRPREGEIQPDVVFAP